MMIRKIIVRLLIYCLVLNALPLRAEVFLVPASVRETGDTFNIFRWQFKNYQLPRTNIVPVITPLTSDGEIDAEGIKRYVAYLSGIGVQAMLVMGATGEFMHLANRKRLEAIKIFAQEAHPYNIKVFANVTARSAKTTKKNIAQVEKISKLSQHRIDGIVIHPLFYLKTNKEILPHFFGIQTFLPVVLYNNPGIAKVKGTNIDQTIVKLLGLPIKDSSGDLRRLEGYTYGVDVHTGDEGNMFPAFMKGAKGGVFSTGSIYSLINELTEKDMQDFRKLQDLQFALKSIRMPLTANLQKIPQGIKFALSLMGICGPTAAHNSKKLTKPDKIEIINILFSDFLKKDYMNGLAHAFKMNNDFRKSVNLFLGITRQLKTYSMDDRYAKKLLAINNTISGIITEQGTQWNPHSSELKTWSALQQSL